MRVIDRDFVEPSNLQRQTLFDEEDAAAGLPKAVAAERRLRALNSDVTVEGVVADLAPDNAASLIGRASLVLDGTDNFEARFLLNDLCLREEVPWVYGACVGAYGLALAVRKRSSRRDFIALACIALVFSGLKRLDNAIVAWTDLMSLNAYVWLPRVLWTPLGLAAWALAWNHWPRRAWRAVDLAAL